jgi:isovaleryl-CoA dehydrogenase
MTAELVFDECKVPVENLVGKEHGAALCMMRNLEIERTYVCVCVCVCY